jgi:DNA invertase Pin-like site-specific DNA recombinase
MRVPIQIAALHSRDWGTARRRSRGQEVLWDVRAARRELLRVLDRLTSGDVVTVTRIDRLAHSTFDLFGR